MKYELEIAAIGHFQQSWKWSEGTSLVREASISHWNFESIKI